MEEINKRLIERAQALGIELTEKSIGEAVDACKVEAIKGIAMDFIDAQLSAVSRVSLVDTATVMDTFLDLRRIIDQL